MNLNFFNTISVPRDIAAVTSLDEASETEPREADISAACAGGIWRAVERLYATGCYPALMFCLRRNGKILFNRAIGHARGNEPNAVPDGERVPATPATPSCLFSASKPMTAMVVHKLEELGELNLLNPVSHYVPEFGNGAKQRITIFQLLAHRAGIPQLQDTADIRVLFDHDRLLEMLCAAEPVYLHGRHQAYHAVTSGVILAEIVKRVTGKDLRRLWREYFKRPLGFKTFDYGATAAVRRKLPSESVTGYQDRIVVDRLVRRILGASLPEVIALMDEPEFYTSVIASANMVTTAEEASRFYQMMLQDGRWRGKAILQPETVHRATMEVGPHRWDRSLGVPLRFSQGFMLGGSPLGLFGQNSHHAYGHLGLINNLTWADTERNISVALLVTGMPLLANNLPALFRLVWAINRIGPAKNGRAAAA